MWSLTFQHVHFRNYNHSESRNSFWPLTPIKPSTSTWQVHTSNQEENDMSLHFAIQMIPREAARGSRRWRGNVPLAVMQRSFSPLHASSGERSRPHRLSTGGRPPAHGYYCPRAIFRGHSTVRTHGCISPKAEARQLKADPFWSTWERNWVGRFGESEMKSWGNSLGKQSVWGGAVKRPWNCVNPTFVLNMSTTISHRCCISHPDIFWNHHTTCIIRSFSTTQMHAVARTHWGKTCVPSQQVKLKSKAQRCHFTPPWIYSGLKTLFCMF